MNNNILENIEIINDIKELTDFINNNYPMGLVNRNEGIRLIQKHKIHDPVIAAVNSPVNPNFVLYENATNQAIYNKVIEIRDYLLTKKSNDEISQGGDNQNG